MKKYFLYISLMCMASFMVNCTDINEIHDEYLKNGETIYIAKVDSIDAFSGDKRILLRLYSKNPRISSFAIFWNEMIDSLIVPVESRVSSDYFDVLIGDNDKIMEEKSYVFEIYSRDEKGHRSIKYEQIAEIYGDSYRSALQNHYYKSANFDSQTSSLTLSWFSSIDNTEIAVEFNYHTKQGDMGTSRIIGVSDLGSSTTIADIDTDYPVSYRTLFLPKPEAIDTFYTDFKEIELLETVNVALNKPVRVSDVLAAYEGHFAVDGLFTNASRWVSATPGEHWIEIDLGAEYDIYSLATWSGASGNFMNPIPNFIFQIDVAGLWKNILTVSGNTNPQYRVEFESVKTSKVRYFVPYSTDNTRLYEIAVYAKNKVGSSVR
ncbi:MAG: DUF4998 domain-containing protein [Mangrovibacterium sp.]